MARTRSQPMSPSGYQQWETPRRTRKQSGEDAPAPRAAAPKAPKPATSRVTKSRAKKGKKPAPKRRLPGSYDDDDEHNDSEETTAQGNDSHDEAVNNATASADIHNNNNNNDSNEHSNADVPRHHDDDDNHHHHHAGSAPSTPIPHDRVQVLIPSSPVPANGASASSHATPTSSSTPTGVPVVPSPPPSISQTAARSGDALHVSPVAETTADVNVGSNDNTNKAPTQSELNTISSRPVLPLPRRMPQRHQPSFLRFSSITSMISPHSLEVSPTPVVDSFGGVIRNGERTSPSHITYHPPPVAPPVFTPESRHQRRPVCPCCNKALVCPDNHEVWSRGSFRFIERTPQRLTPVPTVTGKRQRASDDDDKENIDTQASARDERRPAKKAKRKVIPSREIHRRRQVTPYADRQRRRALESQGKLQRPSLFRKPDENKAAETAVPDIHNDNINGVNYEQPDEEALTIPAANPTPAMNSSPPELVPLTPSRSGWSLGGLFNSVPRSISKLLPTFNTSRIWQDEPVSPAHRQRRLMASEHLARTRYLSQNLSQNLSNETEHVDSASRTQAANVPDNTNARESLPSPATTHALDSSVLEEADDTLCTLPELPVSPSVEVSATQQQTQSQYDEEDLSYDLFPRNHRLSSYSREQALRQEALQARREAILAQEEARLANEELRLVREEANRLKTARQISPSSSKVNANRVTKTTNDKVKRRRFIPNPPGTSYGMDLRYFGSTSSEEAESDHGRAESSASVRPGVLRTTSAHVDGQIPACGALRPRKQVRFDASPPDAPSKTRKRDLTPEVMDDIPESPSHQTAMAQATPPPQQPSTASPEDVEMTTPSPLVEEESDNQPRGQNTYGFTYEELYGDDFFDDIDEDPVPSGAGESSTVNVEVGVLPPPIPRGVLLGHNGQIAAAPPARPPLATMPVPLFRPAAIGAMAVERQMSDMERFRPRLPSSLRTAERYSSSPVPASSPVPQGVVEQGPPPHSFQWPRAAETGFNIEPRPIDDRLRVRSGQR